MSDGKNSKEWLGVFSKIQKEILKN